MPAGLENHDIIFPGEIKMIKCLTKTDSISACDITASQKIITGNYSTHWHEFYEIELIISGRGTYVIDGNCYKIKKRYAFFYDACKFS